MVEIEVVFNERLRDYTSDVWGSLIQPLRKINESAVTDGFSGKRLLLTDVSDYLIKNKCRSFLLNWQTVLLSFRMWQIKRFIGLI